MMVEDGLVFGAALCFALCLALLESRYKVPVLLACALVMLLASGSLVLGGRGVAIPVFALSQIFVVLALFAGTRPVPAQRRPWGGLACGVLALVFVLPLYALPGKITLPKPTGPYAIGLADAVVEDPARGQGWDAISPTPRRLMLRVWYPAHDNPNVPFVERMRPQEELGLEEAFSAQGLGFASMVNDGLAGSSTHSKRDLDPALGPFPLILFSHGYFADVASNTVLMEQLASHGYVVASLSHPGETAALIYPSGQTEPLSEKLVADEAADVVAENDFERITDSLDAMIAGEVLARLALAVEFEDWVRDSGRGDVWMADFRSVLDGLMSAANKDEGANLERPQLVGNVSEILTEVDFSRVAYAGMSFGALAAAGACDLDARCTTAVSLDVGSGPPHLRNWAVRMPLLVLDGDAPLRFGGQDFYYEPYVSAGLSPQVTRITLAGAGHWDFTDLALSLRPVVRDSFPLEVFGTGSGERLLHQQNHLILGFLERRLNRKTDPLPKSLFDEGMTSDSLARVPDLQPLRSWAMQ